jgi:hypothetical protein
MPLGRLTTIDCKIFDPVHAYTVKAPMSGHRRSPIFCPFNRDVRSKEIHLVQRKKIM